MDECNGFLFYVVCDGLENVSDVNLLSYEFDCIVI
jgi:hypothetical protein